MQMFTSFIFIYGSVGTATSVPVLFNLVYRKLITGFLIKHPTICLSKKNQG